MFIWSLFIAFNINRCKSLKANIKRFYNTRNIWCLHCLFYHVCYTEVRYLLTLYFIIIQIDFFFLLSHSTLPFNPSWAHSSLPNRGEKNKTGETRKTKSPPSPMFWCILMLCCVFCSVFEALGTFLALSSLVSIASSCPLPFSESRPYLPWDLQYEIIPTG